MPMASRVTPTDPIPRRRSALATRLPEKEYTVGERFGRIQRLRQSSRVLIAQLLALPSGQDRRAKLQKIARRGSIAAQHREAAAQYVLENVATLHDQAIPRGSSPPQR